ncbi:MAG TPA: NAD-dependent epimerase/dehydratase family protein, partial [Planctomycetota bacterium]|nr:NAD-dependent epimerase/dehydratase family protein [Planctomycetota bacterium]
QAPHPISQILRLLGPLRHAQAAPAGRRDLPGGRVFYESWPVTLECERGSAQLFLAFGREFPESWLHVVGQDGSIRVDLQHGAYAVHEKTRWPDFWESFLTGRRDASSWRAAARESALGYVLGLLKLAPRSDPFFLGMKASLEAFHRALATGAPLPVSGDDGLAVVEACERIARAADPAPRSDGAAARAASVDAPARAGEVSVLGATGFIGRHVVDRLLRAGRPVRILVRDPSILSGPLADERVRVVTGDLGDPAAIARAVDGADAVVHLAAGGATSDEIERTIVEGTRLVAEACSRARVRRLLYASTIAVYYLGPGAPARVTEETPLDSRPRARSHYARTKIESEGALLAMHRDRGLGVAILRPAVVVGEGGRPLHSGVGQWPRDTQCVGWGEGDVPLPLVLVEDVADAFVAAVDAPGIEGSSFNLAGDVRLTAREYVGELARATGRPFRFHAQAAIAAQAIEIGKWLVKAAIRKPGNVFPSWRDLRTRSLAAPLDCSRAKRVLRWSPVADRARFVERGIVAAVDGGRRS